MKNTSVLLPMIVAVFAVATLACTGAASLPSGSTVLDEAPASAAAATVAESSAPAASEGGNKVPAGSSDATPPSADEGAADAPIPSDRPTTAGVCANVVKVVLETIYPRGGALMVRATYVLGDPNARQTCPGPTWTVSPNVAILPTRDPFVIALSREENHRQVAVTAETLNGVAETLTVRLH